MKKWQHDELQSDLAEYLRSKSDVMAWRMAKACDNAAIAHYGEFAKTNF